MYVAFKLPVSEENYPFFLTLCPSVCYRWEILKLPAARTYKGEQEEKKNF